MSYSTNHSVNDYESYIKFINNLNDGFELLEIVLDKEGNGTDFIFRNVNPAYERQTGLKAENILGKRKIEVAPASEQRWYDYATQAAKKGKVLSYEYYNPKVNAYYDTQFIPIPPNQIAVLFKDITERKKAEEKLKSSEMDLEEAQAVAHLGSWKWDLKNKRPEWSAEMYRIYGVDPKSFEITPENALKLTYTADREFVKRMQQQVLKKGIPASFDHRIVLPNGEIRWVHIVTKPRSTTLGTASLIVGTVQDITDRKKAEEALMRSEHNFQDLFEQSPISFEIHDKEGLLIKANNAWEKLWQIPRDAVVGKWNILKSEQIKSQGILLFIKRAYAGDTVIIPEKEFDAALEPELYGKGSKRWLSTRVYPIIDENGIVTSIVVMHEDVTERKQAEKALLEIKDKYQNLVDGLPNMVFEIDTQGQVIFANHRALELTGYSKEEFEQGFDANRLVASEDIERSRKNMKKMFAEGKCQSEEYLFVSKNRVEFPVLLTSSPIVRDNKIVGARGIGVDITERKNLEKQLQDNERLATIGQTAGMVGHDIRNPLQAMIVEIFLMKEEIATACKCKNKEDLTESLVSLDENIGYINKIVQDLQDYARTITPDYSTADLSNVLIKVFENVRISESIQLSIKVKDLERLRTDPMLLQRVLSNLVNNAIQAMPEGGILEITGHPIESKAVITVSDTGVGIPEEVKPKLFKPMMTTKSKGQGFGLAVSKRLIEAMKGTITFESEEGKGTKFIIELPAVV